MLLFEEAPTRTSLSLQSWLFKAGAWYNLTVNQTALPPLSGFHADLGDMVTDTADQAILAFGGQNGSTTLSPTWEFKYGLWGQLSPAHSPSGRYQPALSDDPADGAVLLFGGSNSTGSAVRFLNDTWMYAGGDWVQVKTSRSPPSLYGASAAPEGKAGPILLWGGAIRNTTSTSVNNRTWSFHNASWAAISPTGSYPTYRGYEGIGLDDANDGYALYAWNLSVMAGFHNNTWAPVPLQGKLSATTEVYVGGTMRFVATPLGGFSPVRCTYRFGGTLSAAGAGCNGTESAIAAGSGTLTVWLNDSENESVALTQSYAIYRAFQFLGAILPSVGDVGESLGFAVNYSGGAPPVTAGWDFGDGSRSFLVNTTHVYAVPAVYTIRVGVTDALGSSANALGLVTIRAAPVVRLKPALSIVDANESLGVNVTVGSGVAPYSLKVTFGDGGTANANGVAAGVELFNHVFTRSGSYVIRANLTDQEQQVGKTMATVQVNPPLKLFVAAPAPPESPGLPVFFNVSITGGSAPYSAVWAFGDGGAATSLTPTHSYTKVGAYLVWVGVTDAAAVQVNGTTNVTVTSPTSSPPLKGAGGWTTPEIVAAAGVVAILIAATVLLLNRRRSRSEESNGTEINQEGEPEPLDQGSVDEPES